ncbi:FAD binding domain-containing protein [Naumannella halotolerans]|uniref:FAD binding domain-containing protein n=1 Tax=Naumannella halotolerans TaxID=993414 RepID=UPI001AAE4684|nr:FAD binding domain-containing protein [Naumannella halotolerans]
MDLIDIEHVRLPHSRDELWLEPGEAFMGGGTALYSEPRPGIRGLVDLTAMGWPPIEELPDGGIRIAATCTLEQLAEADSHPLFRPCVDALFGSWKIHRVATVGGNICLALPAGPMTSLTSGLDGTAVIWAPDGRDRRTPIIGFVRGPQEISLAPGELLRAIELPGSALRSPSAMRRTSLTPMGRSAVFVVARADPGGDFAVTITASTTCPVRLGFTGVPTAAELTKAIDGIDVWYADPHGSIDWRADLTKRFAEELRVELGEAA